MRNKAIRRFARKGLIGRRSWRRGVMRHYRKGTGKRRR